MRIIGIGKNTAMLERRGATDIFADEATALTKLLDGDVIVAENPEHKLLKAFTEDTEYGIRVFKAEQMDDALTDTESQQAEYLRQTGDDEVSIAKALHVPVENVLRDKIFKAMIAE